jgi:imidazolonepropionase
MVLVKNIEHLIGITQNSDVIKKGSNQNDVDQLNHAFLIIKNGRIHDFGTMNLCPPENEFETIYEANHQTVLPCFIDTHTHFVFAKSRSNEFEMRLSGKSYQEIADAGGGILNSAKALAQICEEQLFQQTKILIQEAVKNGTGAFEIKSGYGLDLENELKMLRVIQKLKKELNVEIKSTFLGAHALPTTHTNQADNYIKDVCKEFLPVVAKNNLADYVDIFCEKGYFSADHLEQLLSAAKDYDLKGKVHVNQFSSIGGIQKAVKHNALTVDHLEIMYDEDIAALKNSQTIPVGLPVCSLFLDIPYTPARQIIDNDIPLVLASDFNPGSSPSFNMNLVFNLACSQMKMTVNEAFNAITYNAAFAIESQQEIGSIQKGKKANLIFTKQNFQLVDFPYWVGRNIIDRVWIEGVASV